MSRREESPNFETETPATTFPGGGSCCGCERKGRLARRSKEALAGPRCGLDGRLHGYLWELSDRLFSI